MIHKMRLYKEPFVSILNHNKIYELRLYDEKRKLVRLGDTIQFYCEELDESVLVQVEKIIIEDNFEVLFEKVELSKCGFEKDIDLNTAVKTMEQYYSLEEQANHSIVAFQINIIER